jgi:16S rRNA (adenine1518-N6/adenine1519-N6)-dimethyltransferase
MRAVAPAPDDTFLEIGPGRGAMTRALTARARRVIAFEIDRDLAASLQETAPAHLTIVEGDFLDITPAALRTVLSADEIARPIRVAGNLPYNVASPILFKLAELFASGIPLMDAHVMLQREVADRLVAVAGTRDYGVLTVLIRHAADVSSVLSLPPGAFRPPPKVQSAVVRLRFHPPEPAVSDPKVFTGLVRAVFTRRRKTLSNALLAYREASASPRDALEAAGIDGARRPETLSIAEFARLADVFATRTLPAPGRAVL